MSESALPVWPPIELTLHPEFHHACVIELLARVINAHKGNQAVRIRCVGVEGELFLDYHEGVDAYDPAFWDGVNYVLGPRFVDWRMDQ